MSVQIAWFEVMGKDAKATQAFYGDVLGWSFDPMPGNDGYGLVQDTNGVGGGVGEAPVSWSTFYVAVDDLAAAVARAEKAGGTVLMPPTPIPSGTIAVIGDPNGQPVGLAQMTA